MLKEERNDSKLTEYCHNNKSDVETNEIDGVEPAARDRDSNHMLTALFSLHCFCISVYLHSTPQLYVIDQDFTLIVCNGYWVLWGELASRKV